MKKLYKLLVISGINLVHEDAFAISEGLLSGSSEVVEAGNLYHVYSIPDAQFHLQANEMCNWGCKKNKGCVIE